MTILRSHPFRFKRFQLLFFTASLLVACEKNSNTTKPFKKDLTQAVYASGKIYPLNHYKVSAKLPGYVKQLLVKAGDEIKAGSALAVIQNDQAEVNVSSAANLLQLAKENANENTGLLLALKQDVLNARSKYELDSINFSRYQNLLGSEAASRIAFDQAKVQFDISKQNYIKAKSSFENSRQRAQIELKNTQNQYEASLLNRKDYTIYSLITGRVYDVTIDLGQYVTSQIPIMEVGDQSEFEVELDIDETDVALIKNGQKIIYSIDAFKDQTYSGTVKDIYPRITSTNKTSKVIASIETSKSVPYYSGMSVEANVIIEQKKNILVIPREYVIERNKVRIKGQEKLVEIKKGAEDLEFVEVLSGIDEHTEITK